MEGDGGWRFETALGMPRRAVDPVTLLLFPDRDPIVGEDRHAAARLPGAGRGALARARGPEEQDAPSPHGEAAGMDQDASPAREARQEDHFVEGVDERMQLAARENRPAEQCVAPTLAVVAVELDREIRFLAEQGRAEGEQVTLAHLLQPPDRTGL